MRAVLSMIALSLCGSSLGAQPPLPGPSAPPVPQPIVIPVTSTPPPYGYYKSGGILVGADGYLPFDTGAYLLGGFDGLTRYSGSFVMVPPGSPTFLWSMGGGTSVSESPGVWSPAHHGKLFHRR